MWKVADQHDKSVQQRKTLSPRQDLPNTGRALYPLSYENMESI